MRAIPGAFSSSLLLAAASILGSGCILNADAFGVGGSPTTTSSGGSTTSSSTTTDTMTSGGTGGTTSSGGTGGTTSSGGDGGTTVTGGGGTGGVTGSYPVSCAQAPSWNTKQSGVVTIKPPAAPAPIDVYCDQVNMGGGWALVYSSVEDASNGTTTAFWKISKADALKIKAPNGTSPAVNYYAGELYNYGTEYRDDVTDDFSHTAIGVMHAFANGINPANMRFLSPTKAADTLSDTVYKAQFAAGWSSYDYDGDDEGGNINDAVLYANVSQHYAYAGLWGYNLGADNDPAVPGAVPPDYSDGGQGPHLSNVVISGEINPALTAAGKATLQNDGIVGLASRVKIISRWARW